MEIYKKIFGEKLRAARLRVVPKLTQAGLAERLGVEPPSVSRWETGIDFPEDARLPALCKILGVSREYFSPGALAVTPPQSESAWALESARILNAIASAPPHRRLAALYLLTKDVAYLEELRGLPFGAPLAQVLKTVL